MLIGAGSVCAGCGVAWRGCADRVRVGLCWCGRGSAALIGCGRSAGVGGRGLWIGVHGACLVVCLVVCLVGALLSELYVIFKPV